MLKRSIVISLMILLTSACTAQFTTLTPPAAEVQPAVSNTLETVPTATSTPLVVLATDQGTGPIPTFPPETVTAVSACPAPAPHVTIGQQVTVVVEDFDKLKLRSQPEISTDTVKMELNKFTQLKILDGPVCVPSPETGTSFLFWKVAVIPSGEIGWVAEGDELHYFFE